MNRKVFFDAYRPVFGPLKVGQVEGIDNILDEWEKRGLSDIRWLANMLAQVKHETNETFQPVREAYYLSPTAQEAYLKKKKYYPWVGEGLIQVTWKKNAVKFGAKKPGDLMTWPIALTALFDGMIKGMFTGKKLSDYFNAKVNDALHARQIVNGMDDAPKIQRDHSEILTCLHKGLTA